MLQVIRDRAQGFFAWLIVGGIILSFALWGINSYIQDDSSGFVAATVNEVDVSTYEYQIAYQNERARMQQMFGENFDADLFDDQIKNSALDRVIDNALLMQVALDSGFRVSDAQLMNTLKNIPAFQDNGAFSKAAYEQALRSSGEPTSGFESRVRRSLLADQVIRSIASTGFVGSKDVAAIYELESQEREVEYLTISANSFKNEIKISDAEIQEHYQANQEIYKTPEQVQVEYIELSVDDLMASIDVTNDDVEAYYEEQKDRFVTPEERKARHILIEGSDEAAKAKAQALYDQIVAGADFGKLAKENSQDPGSAMDGGMLDYFGHGVMDSSFEDSAFSLKKGEISKPVLSKFGYHIIKLEDIRGGGEKPLAKVRDELTSTLKRQRAERAYFEKVEKLSNLVYEIPDSLTPAVDELGLTIKTSPFFGRAGGAGIASERKVVTATFTDEVLKNHLNSEAIEISENKTVVLRVKEYKESVVRPLEQVKSRIVDELTSKLSKEKAQAAGKAVIEGLASGSLKSVAKAKSYEFKDKTWAKRNDSKVNAEVLKAAFAMSAPEAGKANYDGVSLPNGDYAVLAITAVRVGVDASIAEAEKKERAANLANATGIDEFSFFLKALKDSAEIKRYPGNL